MGTFARCIPALLLLVAAWDATAFTVDDSYHIYSGGLLDVQATLNGAPRWTAAPGAARGLADGIQAAIEPGLAEKFTSVPAEIALFEQVIQSSFDMWESPVLGFDVAFDANAVRGTSNGFEIDLFAVNSTDPVFVGNEFLGVTFFNTDFDPNHQLTNGTVLAGNSIHGADIFLAIDRLQAIRDLGLSLEQTALVLQRLLGHEIGHALGFDHNNVFVNENLDTDTDPTNVMVIDPNDPFAGLMVSTNFDPNAIMSNEPSISGAFFTTLQNDDLGGRDVLYPLPEPGTGTLVLAGLASLAGRRRPR